LNLWIENFATSFKTMNNCVPPQDQWLLVSLLNNTTQRHILVVLLLPEEQPLWKADFSKLSILMLAITSI